MRARGLVQFLEKGELLNFAFQRDFLRPFVDLMGIASSLETKELILGCLGAQIRCEPPPRAAHNEETRGIWCC